ncbi:hypothetical protein GW796_08785 [archaeon]|nr:hypothetical protein [archaeon]NCQ51974.1 hypothetical protein [archaeon]
MIETLNDLFTHYDFGFNLNLISAEDWVIEHNFWHRKIYLEKILNYSQPIEASFNVYFNNNGTIQQIKVEYP